MLGAPRAFGFPRECVKLDDLQHKGNEYLYPILMG